MIDRVVLQNFISHKDTDIQLGRGVTVFVGPNGAGKSSIIDGITFALYGEHVRGPNEALVKDGASGAAVSVEFDAHSKSFFVQRKLDRKGRLEGAVLKETADGVTKQIAAGERKHFDESTTSEEVAKVLGLDYQRMRVAAIIQQGELDSIIRDFSPKDFKELVNSLIGIDGLEAAYQNMHDVIASFRSHFRDLYGYDDTNVPSLEGAVREKEGSLKKNKEGLGLAVEILTRLRKSEGNLRRWISKAEPLRQKSILLQNKIDGLVSYVARQKDQMNAERDELIRVIAKCGQYLPVVARETEVSGALSDVRIKLSEKNQLIEETSGMVAELKPQKEKPRQLARTILKANEHLGFIGRVGDVDYKLREIEDQLQKVEGKLRLSNKSRDKWEANAETARRLEFKNSICPYCGSKVDHVNPIFDSNEIEKHLEAHEMEISELEASKIGLKSKRESLVADAASLKVAFSFLKDHDIGGDGDVRKLEEEKSKLDAELKGLPKKIVFLAKEKAARGKLESAEKTLSTRLTEISAGKEFLSEHKVASKQDVARLSKQKLLVDRLIRRLPSDLGTPKVSLTPRALRALEIDDHSKSLAGEIRTLHKVVARFDEKQYNEKAELLEKITSKTIPSQVAQEQLYRSKEETDEKDLGNLKYAIRELSRAGDFVQLLERIRTRVYHRDGPVPSSLRSWALNHIGLKASEFARSFNIGVSSIQLKEKANHVSIECYGQRGSVETMALSGGEKVAIALALRFGMAYVMGGYKIDFVFLDEPTIHLDPERRAAMVDIVSGLGAEGSPIKQTVIITHDSDIFEDADVDAVYRFEKTSEGTKVALIH